MIVSQIVAVSENWIIGKDNGLPWTMPDDMAWFKRITMGHAVIMGIIIEKPPNAQVEVYRLPFPGEFDF